MSNLAEANRLLTVLNNRRKNHNKSAAIDPLEMDSHAGTGKRLSLKSTGRNIGGRLKPVDMVLFLEGLIEGYDLFVDVDRIAPSLDLIRFKSLLLNQLNEDDAKYAAVDGAGDMYSNSTRAKVRERVKAATDIFGLIEEHLRLFPDYWPLANLQRWLGEARKSLG